MITFNQQNLFDSGPALLHMQSPSLRHDVTANPAGDGGSLQSFGREPRLLTQHGTLLGDSSEDVRSQVTAIEALMDGLVHPLSDDSQNLSTSAVLIDVRTSGTTAVGPRFKSDYTLSYLEPNPILISE